MTVSLKTTAGWVLIQRVAAKTRSRDRQAIEVAGLRKRFGPTLALDGMTFRVEPGRVTGFVGPNGAGKSTTIRVVLGLDNPDEGQRSSASGRSATQADGYSRWSLNWGRYGGSR